jgi:hypothetical protein
MMAARSVAASAAILIYVGEHVRQGKFGLSA